VSSLTHPYSIESFESSLQPNNKNQKQNLAQHENPTKLINLPAFIFPLDFDFLLMIFVFVSFHLRHLFHHFFGLQTFAVIKVYSHKTHQKLWQKSLRVFKCESYLSLAMKNFEVLRQFMMESIAIEKLSWVILALCLDLNSGWLSFLEHFKAFPTPKNLEASYRILMEIDFFWEKQLC
jgi:hypothetical protein